MTREQQKLLNALCGDLAQQVVWSVRIEGADYPTKLTRDDWRHMWAGIRLGAKVVPNPEYPGHFMTLSASSLRLTDEDASEVIDMVRAFGDSKSVRWSDPEEAALRAAYEREASA